MVRAKVGEGRSFILALLMGILASFAVWSLAWTIQARTELTFGITDNYSQMRIAGSPRAGESKAQVFEKLDDVLSAHGAALIVDGQGDGFPGIQAIDPKGVIPWLPSDLASGVEQDVSKVAVFSDTYCARAYAHTQHCELLPPDSHIVGVTEPPIGAGYYQYVVIPHASTELSAARLVVASATPAAVESVATVLQESGFDVFVAPQPPLLRELAENPLVVISCGLFSLGIVFAALYWRLRNARLRAMFMIRMGVGATRGRLIRDFTLHVSPFLLLGTACGTALSVPLVRLISGVAILYGIIPSLVLGVVLSFLLLAIVYAVMVALSLRMRGQGGI